MGDPATLVGNWPWDVSFVTRDGMLSTTGGNPKSLYCPSHFRYQGLNVYPYNFSNIYSSLGYWIFTARNSNAASAGGANEGGPGGNLPPFILVPASGAANSNWQTGYPYYLSKVSTNYFGIAPSAMPIVTDASMSRDGVDFINNMPGTDNFTSHPKGNSVAGGNVLCQDGHAEWRDKSQMNVWCQQGGTQFWY